MFFGPGINFYFLALAPTCIFRLWPSIFISFNFRQKKSTSSISCSSKGSFIVGQKFNSLFRSDIFIHLARSKRHCKLYPWNYNTRNTISFSVSKIYFINLMTPFDFTNDQNTMFRPHLHYIIPIKIQIKDKTWNCLNFTVVLWVSYDCFKLIFTHLNEGDKVRCLKLMMQAHLHLGIFTIFFIKRVSLKWFYLCTKLFQPSPIFKQRNNHGVSCD